MSSSCMCSGLHITRSHFRARHRVHDPPRRTATCIIKNSPPAMVSPSQGTSSEARDRSPPHRIENCMLKNSPPEIVNPSQRTSSEATVFEEMVSDTFANDGIGAAAAGERCQ
jgi:hypothetical protein